MASALHSPGRGVESVLEALTHRRQQHGWQLYGYVVMENHLHLVAQAQNLPEQLARFKSWTVRSLIDHLKARGDERFLHQLGLFRKRHKDDREFQLWEEGSHPQQILSDEEMRQKLECIHYNPVKRGYVDDPLCWRYSSARNYAGRPG